MGDPKKTHRHFDTPAKPWDRKRLVKEKVLVEKYGLKNKRELWKAETTLRRKRENARKLLALPLEKRLKRTQELLASMGKMGLLSKNATLDDVLSLNVETLLERRLQTTVWRKGLAATPKQARQFIVHGHIAVNNKKVDKPSYLLKEGEENKVSYHKKEMMFEEKKRKTKAEKKLEFEETLKKAEGEVPLAEEVVAGTEDEKIELDVEVEEDQENPEKETKGEEDVQ